MNPSYLDDLTTSKPSLHVFFFLHVVHPPRKKGHGSTSNCTCLSNRQKNPRSVAVKVFSLARTFSKKVLPRTFDAAHDRVSEFAVFSAKKSRDYAANVPRDFLPRIPGVFPRRGAAGLSPRNSRRDSWEITGQFERHHAHSYSTVLNRICIRNVMRLLTVCVSRDLIRRAVAAITDPYFQA